MRYREYVRQAQSRRDQIKLEDGAQELGPFFSQPTIRPGYPPWTLDWAILFTDGRHIRIKESYKVKPWPHSQDQGERLHFSFQYGETTEMDVKGMPRSTSNRDTILRVDCDRHNAHMHYGGRNHIQQGELSGSFVISDVDMFDFIEAVDTHRKSGCSFEDYFFFKVIP
jgi:hypothetical protein